MNITKEQLHVVIEQLVAQGEDARELHFWEEIFDTMNEDERMKLMKNLEDEMERLKGSA